MTVAAVILSATTDGSLADTLGQPRVPRLADLAWSGGRFRSSSCRPTRTGPCRGPGRLRRRLGSPAPVESGPVGQMVRGCELATAEVQGTTGFLIWPGTDDLGRAGDDHLADRSPRTDRATILRPAWQGDPGWPVLVPAEHLGTLRAIAPDRMPPQVVDDLVATAPSRIVEMGDPGVVHDVDTAPSDLPAYEGPPDPPAGHTHEWGADVAAEAGLTEP